MWRDCAKAVRELRRNFADAFAGSYHPEQHYMRGPGPKWHAKRADAATMASLAEATVATTQGEMTELRA